MKKNKKEFLDFVNTIYTNLKYGASSITNLFNKYINVDTIPLDVNNRMLRIGFGLNDKRKFFRVDLWSKGFRFTAK